MINFFMGFAIGTTIMITLLLNYAGIQTIPDCEKNLRRTEICVLTAIPRSKEVKEKVR